MKGRRRQRVSARPIDELDNSDPGDEARDPVAAVLAEPQIEEPSDIPKLPPEAVLVIPDWLIEMEANLPEGSS